MEQREREYPEQAGRAVADAGVPTGAATLADGGLPVDRGVCRDLIAGNRYHAAWVGIVSGDHVVSVAAAGPESDSLLDLTTTRRDDTVISEAVRTGELRHSDACVGIGGHALGEHALDRGDATPSTVAVPFWEPDDDGNPALAGAADVAEHEETPDGVLVAYLTDGGELTDGERRALATTAGTLGRHRSRSSGETFDGASVDTRFRAAFQRHDAVMLLIDPDTGVIKNANDAAAAFYGYDERKLTGMKIQEINTASPAEVAAERSRAEREERNYFVFEHELASGEARTVEVHSTPIPLKDGPVLFSVIHDVTEQKEYETELERYGTLFENIPVGLFRSRPGVEGTFEDVNPAIVEMFGADSRDEVLGLNPAELYADPDDRADFSKTLLESGVVNEREYELQRLDGETFWAAISAVRSDTPDGPVFDGIIQDVSERRAYEESLEKRNERMEVLNQLLRHDIRNDMAVIGGTLDILADYLDDSGVEHLDTLKKRSDHVVELTHTARNITESLSIESGETMETEAIRLDQILADELENARSSFPEANFTLEENVPAVTVEATELLDSVFRNLFNNAVQHNDKDTPEVSVRVETMDEQVTVRVADNGPGIPDAQKESIFERGEKGSASSGTGLGLYLVGALVDQYDGEIDVSDNDPEGAVFCVTLNRAEKAEDAAAESDPFGGVAE
jgi:PAS domain S-box-containing protein